MKKILAILAFAPALAAAQTFEMNNESGGKIVLTSRTCVFKGENLAPLRTAFAFSRGGTAANGCWGFIDGYVKTLWFDGSGVVERVYQLDDFTFKEKQ
jgi:hypothetical protein